MKGMKHKYKVVALGVIVAAILAGGAFGANALLITSGSQIKDGVIPASKLTAGARDSLQGNDGAKGATGARGAKGAPGAQGPAGATGPQGPQGAAGAKGADGSNGSNGAVGPQGPAGPKGADSTVPGPQGPKGDKGDAGDSYLAGAYYAVAYYDSGDTNGGAIATVACNAQTDTAISGGVQTIGLTDSTPTPVSNSFPGRMDWDTNMPKANRLDGWIVQFNGTTAPIRVKVWALCVPGLNVTVDQNFTESGT